MKPKIAAMAALVVYVSQKALRLVTIIFFVIVALITAGIWGLAEAFSGWWWVLIVPVAMAVGVFLGLRFIIRRILSTIHRHPFTKAQREQLEKFTAKLVSLAEARATPLPVHAFITLRDILRDRDATTVRKIVDDSATLKNDFAELEKNFGER